MAFFNVKDGYTRNVCLSLYSDHMITVTFISGVTEGDGALMYICCLGVVMM